MAQKDGDKAQSERGKREANVEIDVYDCEIPCRPSKRIKPACTQYCTYLSNPKII
jgi:hypothetical protein